MNEPNLKDQIENEDETLSALARAVAEGDTEALHRLMAGEEEDKTEEETPEVEDENEEKTASEDEEDADKDEEESEQSESNDDDADPEAATSAASTPAKTDDIEALKRELHALRSNAGRVNFMQSRMHQLENELRALRARGSEQNEKPEASTSKPALPAKFTEKLKNLKEIDPDLAETFELMAGMLTETREEAKQTVESKLVEQQELEFYEEQRGILLQAIPQAYDVFATPEWEQWKGTLTPGQRAMAESGHAVDVIRAIHAFAADMQKLYGQTASKSGAASEGGDPTTQTTKAPAQQTDQPKSEVAEARQRKLASAAVKNNPAAKQTKELDPEAQLSEYYNMLAKQNHILK